MDEYVLHCSRFLILALYFSPLVSGANSILVGELHWVTFWTQLALPDNVYTNFTHAFHELRVCKASERLFYIKW